MFKTIIVLLFFSASCQASLSMNFSVGATDCMYTQPAWSPVPIGAPVPCDSNAQIVDQFTGYLDAGGSVIAFGGGSNLSVFDNNDPGYMNFHIQANETMSETVVVTGGSGIGYWQEWEEGDDSEGNPQTVPPSPEIPSVGPCGSLGCPFLFNQPFQVSLAVSMDQQEYITPTECCGGFSLSGWIRFTDANGSADCCTVTELPDSVTPEPSAMLLCFAGMCGVVWMRRRSSL